jgi:hypothetical protein
MLDADMYFDRDGKPMSQQDWSTRFHDLDYKRVAVHERGDEMVSTVWVGMDMGFTRGLPIIFETMVFGYGDWDQFQARYATEEEALIGHEQIVVLINGGATPDDWYAAHEED